MVKTISLTGSSIILQSIDLAYKDEIGDNQNGGNEINLLNPSALKRSTGASYLTFKGAKKSGGNTKKGVEAARGPN